MIFALPIPIITITFGIFLALIIVIETTILEIVMKPIIGLYDLAPGRKNVHTYYAAGKRNNLFMMTFFAITGALSGVIHCIAWNFHFPTRTEMRMWRVLSLLCVPILCPL